MKRGELRGNSVSSLNERLRNEGCPRPQHPKHQRMQASLAPNSTRLSWLSLTDVVFETQTPGEQQQGVLDKT